MRYFSEILRAVLVKRPIPFQRRRACQEDFFYDENFYVNTT